MANDIRATVNCSLGPVISGSIGDDYVQDTGLIKSTGSVLINSLITPAIGTVVTFSYIKSGILNNIPRKFRVKSSFADPYRRTTQVEFGCKLDYLSDLKDRLSWDAFNDPLNSDRTQDEERIVTIPIYASSVMDKCLSELGITASSNPLTNRFSIAEFDFSSGYVSVLSDLLVSESYCGYLDQNEILQVFALDQGAGTGPVITSDDIIDLSPIGVGELPGEAVTVSYSSLRLKPPEPPPEDPTPEEEEQREEYLKLINWEYSIETNSPENYYVNYVLAVGPNAGQKRRKVYSGSETIVTETSYAVITYWDEENPEPKYKEVPTKKVTTTTGPLIAKASSAATEYLAGGVEFDNYTTILSETEEYYYYDDGRGNQTGSIIIKKEPAVSILASVNFVWAYPLSEEQPNVIVLEPVTTELYRTEYTYNISDYVRADFGNPYKRDRISTYLKGPLSQDGQQAIADFVETAGQLYSAEGGALRDDILSWGLVHENTKQTISRTGESNAQQRPPAAARTNAAYAKDDNGSPWGTESRAQLELAVGSATAQRRIELSLPYTCDDTFGVLYGGFYYPVIKSDAAIKANRYGRVQNRLRLGNRNGISLQLSPEKLPASPYSPLYVQANGLTGLYRANGTNWAFDSNGIICSVDALFWGAVGGTGDFWFPVAPGIVTLPETPPITDTSPTAVIGTIETVGATPQTALNAAFPGAVQGDGVQDQTTTDFWVYDGAVWTNVGPNPGPVITTTTVVLPYNETAIYDARLRVAISVVSFGFGLELLTTVPPLVLRTRAEAFDATILTASLGTLATSGQSANLLYRYRLISAGTSFVATGFSAGSVSGYNIGTNAGLFSVTGEQSTLIHERLPLVAEGDAFLVGGQDASFIADIIFFLVESGDFILTGQDAAAPQKYLGVELGAFLVDGADANTSRSSILGADSASYAFNGQDTVLQFTEATQPVKVLLYTGDGATGRSITGAGFEPGFVGIKGRTFTQNHAWHDIVRGKNSAGYLWVQAGETAAEQIPSTGSTISTRGVQDFTADGFTMNGSSVVNLSGANYFALCLQKGTNTSANTSGSLTTQVSARSDVEYSAFTYTGVGNTDQTIGHGLSGAPDLVIIKQRTGTLAWVGGTVIGDNNRISFTSANLIVTNPAIFKTYDSSTIAVGGTLSQNAATYCGWAFKAKTGKSAISTFTGSGSSQHVVTLGYKPQFVMIKNMTSTTGDWLVYYRLDSSTGYARELKFNTTAAEVTSTTVQITSTGFSVDVGGPGNISGGVTSALYLAFADFTLPLSLSMISSAGSYALNGSDSNGIANYILSPEVGNIAVEGQPSALQPVIRVLADLGEFILDGQTTELVVGASIQGDPGAYDLSGQDAALIADSPFFVMTASAGDYEAAGQTASLYKAVTISSGAGQLSVDGQDAVAIVNLKLTAEPGPYSLIGKDTVSDTYFSSWAIQTYGYDSLIYPDWWAD